MEDVSEQLGFGCSISTGREVLNTNRQKLCCFLEIIFYLKFKTILLHTANCALRYLTVS